MINSLVPYCKTLPFFKNRDLSETAIAEVLALMTLREVNEDQFVIEFGDRGDEFFLILEGDVEVLIPADF